MSWCLFCNQCNYKRRLIVHITYQEFTKIMLLVISKLPIVICLRLEVWEHETLCIQGWGTGVNQVQVKCTGARASPTPHQPPTPHADAYYATNKNKQWLCIQLMGHNAENTQQSRTTQQVVADKACLLKTCGGMVANSRESQQAFIAADSPHKTHRLARFMMFILIYFHFIVSWKRIK